MQEEDNTFFYCNGSECFNIGLGMRGWSGSRDKAKCSLQVEEKYV